MASTTFSIAASGDDGEVLSSSASYPPASASGTDDSTADLDVLRWLSGGTYAIRTGHLRFDTSSLPDGDAINSATLKLHIKTVANDDSRNLVFEYYDWGSSISNGDWTATAPASPVATIALSSLTTSAVNNITITDLSGISKTGYTYFRIHISGGQPTGLNWVQMASFDDVTNPEPQLVVNYGTGDQTLTGDATLQSSAAAAGGGIISGGIVSGPIGSLLDAQCPELPDSTGVRDIYLSPSGTDSNPSTGGTISSPFQTLDWVKNNVINATASGVGNLAGYRMILREGTYQTVNWNGFDMTSRGGTAANPFTIEAYQSASGVRRGAGTYENVVVNLPVNNADWHGFIFDRCEGLKIRGIKFTASDQDNRAGGCVTFRHCHYVEVVDCEFEDTRGHGVGVFSVFDTGTTYSSYVRVHRCKFTRVGDARTSLPGAPPISGSGESYWRRGTHALYVGGVDTGDDAHLVDHRCRNVVMCNNVIEDCAWGRGIETGAAAFDITFSCNTIVRAGRGVGSGVHNTEELTYAAACPLVMFANHPYSLGATAQHYKTVRYLNNIIIDSEGYVAHGSHRSGQDASAHGNTVKGNLWARAFSPGIQPTYGTATLFAVEDNTNDEADFLDEEGGDYRLSPTSPAIGAAVDIAWVPTDDFYGNTRSTSAPSLGAFEYAGQSLTGSSAIASSATVPSGGSLSHSLDEMGLSPHSGQGLTLSGHTPGALTLSPHN